MLISKYGNGTIEQVEKFEEKYEIEFDSVYYKFLVKYNGGDTPDTKIKKNKFFLDVRLFYGIGTKENLEKWDINGWKKRNVFL